MRSFLTVRHDFGIGMLNETDTETAEYLRTGVTLRTFNRTSSQYARYFTTHGRCCHLSRCVILGFATGVTAMRTLLLWSWNPISGTSSSIDSADIDPPSRRSGDPVLACWQPPLVLLCESPTAVKPRLPGPRSDSAAQGA